MTITLNATSGITTPSPVVVQGSTSGQITLAAPAVAGTNTVTFPAGTGTVAVNGVSSNIVSGTAQASTSGTSIDFTGIPSWVKRITIIFSGVSTNGTSAHLIQLGDSGGIETTGYISTGNRTNQASATGGTNSTAGFVNANDAAANTVSGHWVLTNVSGNSWVCSHTLKLATTAAGWGGGDKTLSDTLTQVRITTVNGTDTFDAGTINILYE